MASAAFAGVGAPSSTTTSRMRLNPPYQICKLYVADFCDSLDAVGLDNHWSRFAWLGGFARG